MEERIIEILWHYQFYKGSVDPTLQRIAFCILLILALCLYIEL
jgi:hypothetical protein